MAERGADIEKAKYYLEAGKLVAIPTETVYGLAGNALNAATVASIFSVKGRPQFDPLIVHVPNLHAASAYTLPLSEKAAQLANKYWPGPLTLIAEKKEIIPDLVTAGLETVGIRCPDHVLTRTLLENLQFPLAAPSANPFGYISPTKPEHVEQQLGSKIAYILDGGTCSIGIESTIVGFENDEAVIYRLGGLSVEDIEQITGPATIRLHASSNPKAPGQLTSHYAPAKKIVVGKLEELLQHYPAHCAAILSFQQDLNSPHQFILSPSGNMQEAAQNFFSALRILDNSPTDIILAELVPETGLGKAINDRLRRASAGNRSQE